MEYRAEKHVTVHVDYLSIRASQRNDEPVELRFNTSTVSSDGTLKWLERVLDVIDADSIEQVNLYESQRLDDVCEALTRLKEVRTLCIRSNCPNRFAKKALKILTPVTSETVMFKIPFKNRKELEIYMMSSTKSLTIFADRFSKFKYSIQAFFVSNSLRLKLKQWSLMEHSINQFLTKWLQNEHNSPLEHLSIDNDENFYIPHVLEGLDAVPFLEERLFHYSAQLDIPPKTIYGGYDIRGMNGKKVTIRSGFYRIDFYVWP
ncbi:hypothetical protein GCK72_021279 [Caenorhabditis remanei]|uniref:Sdz-33 F-box domain-containing protein n=1 Tax=Caenorhabditis remanei TaxID=31234 RepID=A0A6A5GJG2_CAERE|nr:hypothetical protein GCK72_021279 [Caenorhabditis remanei]KAF1754715.1 hypothetical protein GCK72_021279 [Caenorhabditis remanei]